MSGDEIGFIKDAFDQNWVAPLGPNVDGFERDLAEYCGVDHVAALSSGTAAIHLALIILGVKPGDEVIASTFTFAATVNPIVYQGAIPILIDSEPSTWNMEPNLLEAAIKERLKKGKKPKAIIPVHLYGMPANMNAILEIANRFDIPVIEDAAEALGSRYKGKSVGSFGKMAVLSFNGNKIITTSGGGALLSNDEDIIVKARFLATQARDKAPHYQHSSIGYNYRMSNILAGIGRGQMKVINDRVAKRRDHFRQYIDKLTGIPGIGYQDQPDDSYFSNRWLTAITIIQKQNGADYKIIMQELEKLNIESRPLWKPMHLQPVFRDYPSYINGISQKLFENGICLPSGSNLTLPERNIIIQKVLNCLV